MSNTNTPHFHQCPRPSCKHIWQHTKPRDGFNSSAHFDHSHTCPKCRLGRETEKCDANGTPTRCTQTEACSIVDQMIAYEQGDLNAGETVELFQRLIDTGTINHLQGSYGRTAQRLYALGLVHS